MKQTRHLTGSVMTAIRIFFGFVCPLASASVQTMRLACLPLLLALAPAPFAAEDLVLADFEGDDYGAWTATGDAFGTGPARGTLPGQMPVAGFNGKGLVNSFTGGDRSTGKLVSPKFRIERSYLSFLIGGGGFPNETCISLLVDGWAVRTATGPNTQSGGSERLQPHGWDVRPFIGREAVLEIIDRRTGGWGHINIDHIVQTDRKPPIEQVNVTRTIRVNRRYLHLPVRTGAAMKKVEVQRKGAVERFFDIELADENPEWWAFLDVSPWMGEELTIKVNRLRDDSRALESISQDDEIKGGENLYREPLRPQLHFSPRRGWNNDPNGLAYYRGEYHLFFQHNPYGWNWGNMHWGHAVSRDLVHWTELPKALYPDDMGPMFSGSAVVDWKNTSGFGKDGRAPLVMLYTAAGNPTVQCLAYSTDGRTFTKYAGNPIVKQITPGNRDPKVIWHEPTKRWVMTLYVGFEEDRNGKRTTRHTIQFLTSPDLKEWTTTSHIDGFYECPDLFELPVNGDAGNRKWVLTAASSEYMVGTFDGEKFTPETARLPGHRGKGFYAAQTFSDIPASDGRCLQFGWLQAPSPGMPFNQCMSLPLELSLRATPEGPRLVFQPARELQALERTSHPVPITSPGAGVAKSVTTASADTPLKVVAAFEPGPDSELTFRIHGATVTYDAGKQEVTVNGHRAPAPLRDGRQELMIFADRTTLEVFASDGLVYIPIPALAKGDGAKIEVSHRGASLKSPAVRVIELTPIWVSSAGGRRAAPDE